MDGYEVKGLASTKPSPMAGSFERISKKLSSLRSVLSPVIRSIPTAIKESNSSTELSSRLQRIEDDITDLLDTIEI